MERAGLFEDFDVNGFEPARPAAAPPQEAVRKVSEATNFKSREPENPPQKAVKRNARVYRTGRNAQFNIKARSEDIQAFYEIADSQGWVLGETLQKAVEALKKDIKARGTR